MKAVGKGIKGLVKLVVGTVVVVIVLIVLVAALVSAGAKQAQKESDKHAITLAQYKSLRMGTSKRRVEHLFGRPNSSDSYSSQFGNTPVGEDCIYYNERGHLLQLLQFCFDHSSGKLESKTSA